MTQEQRHKDLDDAGHAPHAAAGHPEPGKRSLTRSRGWRRRSATRAPRIALVTRGSRSTARSRAAL